MSEKMKDELNKQTGEIIQQCLKETEQLLTKEKVIYERFAHELLTRDELEYDDIEAIFTEYGKPNPRLFSYAKTDGNGKAVTEESQESKK